MTPIIIHTSGTSNNAFRMSDINTLGVIDQRRSTILICEALDQLLSALSSLARALKTLIQGSSRTLGNESEGLNVDSNQVLAQRERKNLPDLLLDLPANQTDTVNMTLCNAGPDVLPGKYSKNHRVIRQDSDTKRRRDARNGYNNCSCGDFIVATTTRETRPGIRENAQNCDNCRHYHRSYICSPRIERNNTDFVLGNNSRNIECSEDLFEHQLNCSMYYKDDGDECDNQLFNELSVQDFSEGLYQVVSVGDTANSSINLTTINQDSNIQIAFSRSRAIGTNSVSGGHQLDKCNRANNRPCEEGGPAVYQQNNGVMTIDSSKNHGGLDNVSQPQSQGSGDNPNNNNGEAMVCQQHQSQGDPNHEFTTELVRALRNIGDNLDSKLREQDQCSPLAIMGVSKINTGKLLVSALRHHNILGVALGASLEMCLLLTRL